MNPLPKRNFLSKLIGPFLLESHAFGVLISSQILREHTEGNNRSVATFWNIFDFSLVAYVKIINGISSHAKVLHFLLTERLLSNVLKFSGQSFKV